MDVCYECCVLSGRGLCDELITRPEESYRLWCVIVCDLETSRMRPRPRWVAAPQGKKIHIYNLMEPPSYMRSVVARNLVMRRMSVVQTTDHRTETVCEISYTMRHIGDGIKVCVWRQTAGQAKKNCGSATKTRIPLTLR